MWMFPFRFCFSGRNFFRSVSETNGKLSFVIFRYFYTCWRLGVNMCNDFLWIHLGSVNFGNYEHILGFQSVRHCIPIKKELNVLREKINSRLHKTIKNYKYILENWTYCQESCNKLQTIINVNIKKESANHTLKACVYNNLFYFLFIHTIMLNKISKQIFYEKLIFTTLFKYVFVKP